MKKLICSCLLLFFNCFSSYATTFDNFHSFEWPTCNIPQNEWRIGIGIGIEYINLEAKVKDDFSVFGSVLFGNREQTQKKLQVVPSFEVGKTNFNHYYMGIITSWHYSGAHKESRLPLKFATYFTHKFKLSHYLDILAKLGYRFTPKMMTYILAGPSIAKWSHTTTQFKEQVPEDTCEIKKTSVGMGLGFGLEYVFCSGVGVNLDYTHHFYKEQKAKKYMRFIDNFGRGAVTRAGLVTKKITPSSDAVMVRVSYYF